VVQGGGSNSAAGVREGDLLDGKYRVERVLGVGGMGAVVAAHHIGLDEKVAIKFLLPGMLANPEAVSRFAREARNTVKIKGEHVARVFDVGTLENGAPYMVMEFLDGADLDTWLKQRGPLPFEEAIDFVLQTCEAIAEAHALSIVHRDLKPANLFCIRGANGRLSIKVLDFGISKVTELGGYPSNMGMTSATALMGSPFYMSPEQLGAPHTVDVRTDIWALGVILQELITGRVPFPGETLLEVARKVTEREPQPLQELRPDTPPGVQAVVWRCLEKDRERRYGNVGELALALFPFAPKRAKASIERITDIITTAGLSASEMSMPPSSGPPRQPEPAGSIAPLGRTFPRLIGSQKAVAGVIGLLGALALAGVMTLTFVAKRGTRAAATDSQPATAPLPVPAKTATTWTVPVAPPLAAPEYAPPTATPAPTLPVIDPSSPQPIHQDAKRSLPEAPKATAAGPKWAPAPAATKTPPPTAPPSAAPAAAKLDCEPNYTVDPQSGAHVFKPACFPK
jgi:serine/threonine protein kinase